ncbi:flippase-like domain-containing protein [Candidatus Woesearchaeota archaeon]|nr:flippase-like domain-containing protein [Candidatus Woesearchaeota archaeon]
MNIKLFLKIAFSLFLLSYLVYLVDFKKVLEIVTNTNPVLIPLLFFFCFLVWFMNGITVHFFIRAFNIIIPFWKIVKLNLQSIIYGLVLPGKLGELSIVYLLKKEGLSTSTAVTIAFLDKFVSFSFLALLSIFGFFIFLKRDIALIFTLLVLIIIFLTIFLFFTKKGRILFSKFIFKKYREKFSKILEETYLIFKKNPEAILINIVLTILKWVIYFISFYVVLILLNVNISFLTLSIIIATSALLSFIPITIAGLGIRETSGFFMLTQVGIDANVSATVFLLITATRYVLGGILLIYYEIKSWIK